MPPSRPSVIDIARSIGMSPSTVCRALNGKEDVSAATVEKVRAACAKLGYTKNRAASDLRQRGSRVIACLMPEMTNELATEKLHHLRDRVTAAGYRWQLHTYRGRDEGQALFDELLGEQPAGLLLRFTLDPAQRRMLKRSGIPAVAYDQETPGLDSVILNRVPGVLEGVRLLLAEGRTRIVLMGEALTGPRGRGYYQAHDEAGAAIDSGLIVTTPYGRDLYAYGYEEAGKLLAEKQPFDAVMAINDACAIGAMRAVREDGRSVPRDVAIIGFDDIPSAAYAAPPLTTVTQPVEAMAEKALALLLSRIQNPAGRRRTVTLSTELLLRSST